jgi:hypothetical protein
VAQESIYRVMAAFGQAPLPRKVDALSLIHPTYRKTFAALCVLCVFALKAFDFD